MYIEVPQFRFIRHYKSMSVHINRSISYALDLVIDGFYMNNVR